MSIEALSASFRARGLKPTERVVLYALANYADRTGGSIYPSLRTLSADVELDPRWVRRILRRLEDGGYIEARGMSAAGTVLYRILLGGAGESARGGVGGGESARRSVDPISKDRSEVVVTDLGSDRKSTRLNSSHVSESRMPSSA